MAPWVGVHVGPEASDSRGGCQRGEGGASFAGFNWRRLRVRFGAASGEAYALSCRRGQRERRFGGLMAAMWLMGRRVSWIGRERHGGGCRRGESPGEGHTLATGGCGERRRGGAAKGHARRRILCRVGAGAGASREAAVSGEAPVVAAWWGGEGRRSDAARGCTRRGRGCGARFRRCTSSGLRRRATRQPTAGKLVWRRVARAADASAGGRRIFCRLGTGASAESRRAGEGGVPARATG